MAEAVLDASAVLAVLYDEAGADVVIPYLSSGCISVVNMAEVITRLVDDHIPEAQAWLQVKGLVDDLVAFDESQARVAAALRATTRSAGLSLGDHACLALAQHRGTTAITADRSWKKLKLGIDITCIR